MTSTLASMYLRENLAALLPENASHEDAIGTTTVEIPLYHRIAFSQSHYSLSGHMVFGKDIVFQVVPDLGDPCIATFLSRCGWLYKVSRILNRAHNPGRAPQVECRRDH